MPVSLTGPREIIHCEMISYGSQRIRQLTMETAVVITPHTIFLRHLMVVVSNAHLYIICDPSNCALGVRHVLIFFAAV
jgi:hypothetical protein